MNILQEKSYKFALRIVNLSEHLNDEKKEFVLSKKILDSGTNIGLLIEEGKQGEDRAVSVPPAVAGGFLGLYLRLNIFEVG